MKEPGDPAGESSYPAVAAPPQAINVLMYHSIADAPGPTSIAPQVFADQMDALAHSGCAVIPLSTVVDWIRNGAAVPERSVAITFDDGFADFIPAARVLAAHGYPATVFLPTGRIGSHEDWGDGTSRRPLMQWDDVAALAAQGVEFGGHSVTHPDLTSIPPNDAEREIAESRHELERRLNRAPAAFAPPFGASNASVRAAIARHFNHSVGTTFARADRRADPFDIPRIEMHYFRDPRRWRGYLDGRAEWYFIARRMMRGLRRVAAGKGLQ